MINDELRALLSGYAAGTLTDAEQKKLFAASLENQEVFDALADEQLMRDTLAQTGAKDALLEVLEPPARRTAWLPSMALAASIAVGGFLFWPKPQVVAPVVTVAHAPLPPTPQQDRMIEEPKPQPKMKARAAKPTTPEPLVVERQSAPAPVVADTAAAEARADKKAEEPQKLAQAAPEANTFVSPMMARREAAMPLRQHLYAFRITGAPDAIVATPIPFVNPIGNRSYMHLLKPEPGEEVWYVITPQVDRDLEAALRGARPLPERAWRKIQSN